MSTKDVAPAIGIDLGTTNSCVAVVEGRDVKVIPNSEGYNTTPSVVAFTADGEPLVGLAAKRQAVTNPDDTFAGVKRLIGRKADDPTLKNVKCRHKIAKGNGGDAWINSPRKGTLSPSEISAKVLMKMKSTAEQYLGMPVKDAVITVPAYFDDAQRQATKNAGKIAGLNVLRIINEPTAAALAYGLEKGKEDSKIIVFDLGGGTFDVSVLELGDGVFEVKATGGDTALGGEDFDARILEYFLAEFKKSSGIDASSNSMSLQRLKDAAEEAKIALSTAPETAINLPFLAADERGPHHFVTKLTKAKFESMIADLVSACMNTTEKVLADSGFKKGEIDEVVLVGGSTRIPIIQARVKQMFGKEPNKSVNPDEVVAKGAAIQANVLSGGATAGSVLLLDVTPLSIGIETLGGVCTKLIAKNTTIPTKKSQVFSTAGDNQSEVHIKVFQGEREMASDNKLLGHFTLSGIPPAPRGTPQIEVSFDVDANGLMTVSAKDLGTSKEQKITIQSSGGLSKEDIERMKSEAEKYYAEDAERRALADAKNEADSLIYSSEKALSDFGDKVPADSKQSVGDCIKNARDAIEKNDLQSIKSAIEALSKESHKLSAIIYQQSGNEGGGSDSAGSDHSSGKEKVVDSEYEDYKEDNNSKK